MWVQGSTLGVDTIYFKNYTLKPFKSKDYDDSSDEELVKLVLKGDRYALNILIDKHQPYIYNLAWKMAGSPVDAADLSKEVLLNVISNHSK